MSAFVARMVALIPTPLHVTMSDGSELPGQIPIDFLFTDTQLAHNQTVIDVINSELNNVAFRDLEEQVTGRIYYANSGKFAADVALTQFVAKLELARQLGGHSETLGIQSNDDLIYIPISPTKHLKSSGLYLQPSTGSPFAWTFMIQNIPVSTGFRIHCRMAMCATVLVQEVEL